MRTTGFLVPRGITGGYCRMHQIDKDARSPSLYLQNHHGSARHMHRRSDFYIGRPLCFFHPGDHSTPSIDYV